MPRRRPANARAADRAFVGRTSEPDGLAVVRSDGDFVFDARGRKYIDLVMGWCVGNLGWAKPELHAALERFAGPDYVTPSSLYAPWAELAEMLARLTPGRLARSFRATTGTEAVELAIQAAQSFTGRRKLVGIAGAYHGNSIGARSIVRHGIKPPLDERALDRVETALKRRDVAAFVMEPIICNLGALVPDAAFLRGLGALCRRYGTLLVFDEVATGFGRTGALFASEHFDVEPDILCLAKAITGGVVPMGATVMTAEVADGLDDDFSFYATWGWHPRAVAVALANLRYLARHRRPLMAHVEERGAQLRYGLRGIDWGVAAEVRGRGLAVGVALDGEGRAEEVQSRCRDAGLLVSADDDLLMLFPSLTVDAGVLDEAVAVLADCAR